jgi:hypothetical protein
MLDMFLDWQVRVDADMAMMHRNFCEVRVALFNPYVSHRGTRGSSC